LEAIEEHVIERAAIAEFDGCLPRIEADAQARAAVRTYHLLLDAAPAPGWHLAVTAGADPRASEQHLVERYGPRLLAVHPHPLPTGNYP
jgi:hypothetical protein